VEKNLFELRIKGELDPFIGALAGLGCECRIDRKESLEVTTPDNMPSDRIFAIARDQNVQIRHFYAKKDSLEDIFIKIMEDEDGGNGEVGMRNAESKEVAR
jgi:hypothetical protein